MIPPYNPDHRFTLVVGGRQWGKTQALIEWVLASPNHVVMVSDSARAKEFNRRLRERAKEKEGFFGAVDEEELRKKIVLPGSFSRGFREDVKVGIDQLGDVLYSLIGAHVALATEDLDIQIVGLSPPAALKEVMQPWSRPTE